MSIEFGWWNKDADGKKFQVSAVVHGGNIDMIGWQLVGFPGPRMSNIDDVTKHYGEAFRPKAISLEQSIGRKVRPSEDEDLKS